MPYKSREDNRKYQREWKAKKRAENIANGICVNCSKPALFGHTRCQGCIDVHRAPHHNAKQRERRKKLGLCVRCGRPKEKERYYCPICRMSKAERAIFQMMA